LIPWPPQEPRDEQREYPTVKVRAILTALLMAAVFAACGGGDPEGAETLGESASPDDADITIEVTADDPFEFDPETIEVEAGQTVLFQVTNEGDAEHEFQIGGSPGGMAGHSMEGHLHLNPGESGELAWAFPEAGEVEFACHIAGHYESGMKGKLTVR
jgi:uncharacterized cupredoxin-like copper-binding protein